MKLSTSWIKKALGRTISDRELAEALEDAGIEVDQLISSPILDQKLIVGLVKECVQHPNADRLHIAKVDVGTGELVQIVCGAPNVRVGLIVAVAQIGTTLPDGTLITEAKLRGETSYGMLCSARELGLSEEHDGLFELDVTLKVGTPLSEVFPADGQIELKTAANRPDLQSVNGVAREAAAQLDHMITHKVPSLPMITGMPMAAIEADTMLAKQFILIELKLGKATYSLSIAEQQWLRTSNVRNISPIVDVTNIGMIATGQPLHAYDADKVQGLITVRMAKDGETIVTLDGKKRTLSTLDLVIADEAGPIGIAGVMGGERTSASATTKRIYLEAASFDGATIRKAARRHNLRSEASARFERDLPLEFAVEGAIYAVDLLQREFAATVGTVTHLGTASSAPLAVTLSAKRLERLVKDAINLNEAAELLPRLGFEVTLKGENLIATAPYWRPDVKLPEDLIEEVVRLAGYDRISATIPTWTPRSIQFDRRRAWRRRVSDVLLAAGLFEVHTYSFVSLEQIELIGEQAKDYLELENPMSKEQAYLRRSPLPSLLATLGRNETYRNYLGLYEVTGVFIPGAPNSLPDEPERLAVIWQSRGGAYATVKGILDALATALGIEFDMTISDEAIFAPGRGAQVHLGGKSLGMIGQLAPALVRSSRLAGEVAYLELDMTVLIAAARDVSHEAPNRFPAALRDLTIATAKATSWQDIRQALRDLTGVRASYLSEYHDATMPAGQKNLSIRLELTAPDHTLTDAEIETLLAAVTRALPTIS